MLVKGVLGNVRFSQERLQKKAQALDSECTFSPVINKHRKASQEASADSSPASERLFAASAVRAKRLAEAAESAARQHTFKPSISKRAQQVKREPGVKTHEALYAKVRLFALSGRGVRSIRSPPQHAKTAAAKESMRLQREMEGCTFKPQLSKKAKALKYGLRGTCLLCVVRLVCADHVPHCWSGFIQKRAHKPATLK